MNDTWGITNGRSVINIVPFPNQPGMNLERVEERALSYLRQSRYPLVPLRTLLEHIQRDEMCANLSERILLDFVTHHEQIVVVESGPDDAAPLGLFEEAGLEVGPKAILKERMPTAAEMSSLLRQNMDNMLTALRSALSQAKEAGDAEAAAQVRKALARSEELERKIRELM